MEEEQEAARVEAEGGRAAKRSRKGPRNMASGRLFSCVHACRLLSSRMSAQDHPAAPVATAGSVECQLFRLEPSCLL